MAAKRKVREAQLAFEALSIEGGLLSPEWLAKVAQLQAGSQAEADYRVPKGLTLRDEIGRYWRIAQAHWVDFKSARDAKADPKVVSDRFVLAFLRDAFGFESLTAVGPMLLAERSYPIGHAALGAHVPIIIAPAGCGLDTLSAALGTGSRRRSAFGLAQEYLNAHQGALWGIVSDGVSLRIVRDNASLTRPAWVEADLQRIFEEERYADFAALWLLCHETRFGRAGQPSIECALEMWRDAGREEGIRAREHLRRGVEEALLALGQGFLSHPENYLLRSSLQSGELRGMDYFSQLLRLVYRLIFLLTVEERGLLHPDGTSAAARSLYSGGYSIRRLRERSVKRSAHDRFSDLWDATKVVLRGLAAGEPRLGLPALSGLFAQNQSPVLDAARLENRALLLAVFKLAWLREAGGLSRVNWRDMGPEELGSVYESLLELVPHVTQDGRQFAFAEGETRGNARKTSGSYYTPDSLVQVLLDRALEPVVASTMATHPDNTVAGLLNLSIVDPACGSGHFLLAAARRLAAHVARLQANGTPSAAEYRHALRQVVGRCIYGVDLNPMAVELCKVGLWMEAVEPGLPLTFLDSHVQQGNAVLGTTPQLMEKGIPDAAWNPVDGDDRKTASALKKRNKAEAGGQRTLDFVSKKHGESESQAVSRAVSELDAAGDSKLEELRSKELRWNGILDSPEYVHQKFVADAWCAAFVWPKQPGDLADGAPTNELWRQLRDGQTKVPELTRKTIEGLAHKFGFFHWPLQFPQVFMKGGFDVVLGNPPWDTLSPDRREFFSRYRSDMRSLSPAEQEEVIQSLLADKAVADAWYEYERRLLSLVLFLKESGRFTLYAEGNLGKGDFNIYRMFAELALKYTRLGGYAAQVLPGGLYGGANASAIRQFMFDRCALKLLLGCENKGQKFFRGVHAQTWFSVYAAQVGSRTETFSLMFGIESPDQLLNAVSTANVIDADFIRASNPETYTIADIRSLSDLTISQKMLAAHPSFGDEAAGPPFRHYQAELHMGNDRELFTIDPAGLPVYEGRMISNFDHRAKTYAGGHGNSSQWVERTHSDPRKAITPQWRLLQTDIPKKLGDRCSRYRVGFGDVANPRNERSFVASLIPPGVICGHKVPTVIFDPEYEWAYLPWLAVANSFVMDWMTRSKLSSPSLTYSVMDSLPFPRSKLADAWVQRASPIVLGLTCTAQEMTPFWNRMAALGLCRPVPEGNVPPEALIDENDRELARAELDALVAHDVYGLTRVEFSAVLETFQVLKRREMKLHGEYRTKRSILEAFDSMSEGARNGRPYQLTLEPGSTRPAANVLPFATKTPARRSLPAWSPGILAHVAAATGLSATAGAWGTALTGFDLGIAALAAVLRNLDAPASRDEVERAVVLVILPNVLQSKLDAQMRGTWSQVIGAANLAPKTPAGIAIPWGEVVRRAVIEQVLHVGADSLWSAGPDVNDAPSVELDARALVSLSFLAGADKGVNDQDIMTELEGLRAA
jgi:hypothetical protein